MHFLKMVKKLTKENKGRKLYAYGQRMENSWLLRMHVTKSGDPIIEYTLPCHTCEESDPHYYRIYKPTGADMGIDWSFSVPKAWIKPKELQWMDDQSKECRRCAMMTEDPQHFCARYNKFVSPVMGCKRFISHADWAKQQHEAVARLSVAVKAGYGIVK